jgi:hypothetical protein
VKIHDTRDPIWSLTEPNSLPIAYASTLKSHRAIRLVLKSYVKSKNFTVATHRMPKKGLQWGRRLRAQLRITLKLVQDAADPTLSKELCVALGARRGSLIKKYSSQLGGSLNSQRSIVGLVVDVAG